jgi:hypothetical protein
MARRHVTDDLRRAQKEPVVATINTIPGFSEESHRYLMNNPRTEIRIEVLPNRSLQLYCYSKLLLSTFLFYITLLLCFFSTSFLLTNLALTNFIIFYAFYSSSISSLLNQIFVLRFSYHWPLLPSVSIFCHEEGGSRLLRVLDIYKNVRRYNQEDSKI